MHVTSEQRERAVTDAHLLCVCMYADWGGEVAGKGGGGRRSKQRGNEAFRMKKFVYSLGFLSR